MLNRPRKRGLPNDGMTLTEANRLLYRRRL